VIAEFADGDRLTDGAIADAARHFPITTIRRLGRLLDSLDLAPSPAAWSSSPASTAARRSPPWTRAARRTAPSTTGGGSPSPLRSTRTCDPHQVLQPPIAPRTPSWKFGSPAPDRLNRKGNKQFHVGS